MKTFPKNNLRLLTWVLCIGLLCCNVGCSEEPLPPTTLPAAEPVTYNQQEATVPPINNQLTFVETDEEKTLFQYYSENEDTIGWLTIPGIKTDNIVMMGQNKAYPIGEDGINHYLNRTFHHEHTTAGELYIDARCRLGYDTLSQNLTLYGHHMKDGTMLAGLDYYEREDYYLQHQYFTLHTLWDTYHYRAFAIFVIDLNKNQHLEFNFRQESFADGEEFLAFIDKVKQRSLYQTDVPIAGDDKVINLVTCTYPTGNPDVDDARLIMMGRLCTDPTEIQAAEAALASK